MGSQSPQCQIHRLKDGRLSASIRTHKDRMIAIQGDGGILMDAKVPQPHPVQHLFFLSARLVTAQKSSTSGRSRLPLLFERSILENSWNTTEWGAVVFFFFFAVAWHTRECWRRTFSPSILQLATFLQHF